MKIQKRTTLGGQVVFGAPLGKQKPRFWELDFIRGLFVVLMCFDHFAYVAYRVLPNFVELFHTGSWMSIAREGRDYWTSDYRLAIRPFILFGFLLLCGISCTLSRSNEKRSADIMAVALAVSSVTYAIDVFVDETLIVFGVIHMLGVAVALYVGLAFVFDSVAKRSKGKLQGVAKWTARLLPGIVGFVLLVVYFRCCGAFCYGELKLFQSTLPAPDTEAGRFFGSIFVSFDGYNFKSADYYPLLPYAAIVWIGTLFGWIAYRLPMEKGMVNRPAKKWNAGICWIGRKAIWFYAFHQITAMAFFFLGCLISWL